MRLEAQVALHRRRRRIGALKSLPFLLTCRYLLFDLLNLLAKRNFIRLVQRVSLLFGCGDILRAKERDLFINFRLLERNDERRQHG